MSPQSTAEAAALRRHHDVEPGSIFEERESAVRSYCRSFPALFTSATGALLHDADGRSYIDFLAGAGALNYGHNHETLKAALVDYIAGDGITHALDLHTAAKERFLRELTTRILEPRGLDHRVQFTGPTGTNAVEAAFKVARKATGRTGIVAFMGGYHGHSLGSLAATANLEHRAAAGVPLGNVTFLPFPGGGPTGQFESLGYLRAILADSHSGVELPAAVIVETVQAEGGVNVAPVEWLQELRAICDEHGIVLIVDEIQTGCGRTGPFFSFERAGIVPDVVTVSKSISGYGLPMAITLLRPELDLWQPAEHTGTFRGNNLAFVGATVALETYWSDSAFSERVLGLGAVVKERLERMAARHPDVGLVVRGRGMIWGMVSEAHPDIARRISAEAFTRGLIIETSGAYGEVLKLLSPLTISDDELERGLAIIEQSLDAVLA